MKRKSSIIGNASWIIFSKIVQSLLGLIITMFTARYLGPSNYGLINYAASIVAFITPMALLGIDSVLVQELIFKDNKEEEILGSAIGIAVLASLLCIVGEITFCFISTPNEHVTIIVCGIYGTILFFQAGGLIQYWFQAKLLSKYASITMLLAYIITSGYKILLLITHRNIYWFALSNVLDAAIIAFLLIIIYKKLTGNKLIFSKNIAKKIVSKSKYYILANLMISICSQTDKIMLKIFVDEKATGLYSAAVSCATMTGFIFSAIIDSFRPAIFEANTVSKSAFENSVKKLYCTVIYMSIVQCIVLMLFSHIIVTVIYGKNFMDAAQVLGLVVWYTMFAYIGSVRGIWMLAVGLQKYVILISAFAAGGNLVLNAIFIPFFGIYGAAFASLISQIIANIIVPLFVKVFKDSNKLLYESLNPKYLIYIILQIINYNK